MRSACTFAFLVRHDFANLSVGNVVNGNQRLVGRAGRSEGADDHIRWPWHVDFDFCKLTIQFQDKSKQECYGGYSYAN